MTTIGRRDEAISAVDITTDNRIVAARGAQVEFRSGDSVIQGYQTKFKDDTVLTPTKLMFNNRNRNILMLTPQKSNVLVRVDTETGKNLGQVGLKFHEEVDEPIDCIVPVRKFAQYQANETVSLVGASNNSLFEFEWDTRVKGDTLVVTPDRKFSKPSKMYFTSVATTSNGNIVAGSSDGVVRLFQSPSAADKHEFKRAKTNLNQLADPVIGVDTSSSGEWVVWTTKEYIAVVNTFFVDKNAGTTHSGFDKSMGQQRPDALVLRIPEEDLKRHGIEEVNFTHARFDNSPYYDIERGTVIEEEIVASTGAFLVRWKFRQVKLDYARDRTAEQTVRPIIYRQQEEVVDKVFEFGRNNVVAAFGSNLATLNFSDDE